MKREILFRAQRVDNKAWVEGYYYPMFQDDSEAFILSKNDGIVYQVIPESVCQFTGLTDKNGTQIFEGDIITVSYPRCSLEKQIGDKSGVVRYLDTLPRFMIMEDIEPNCVAISSFNNTGEGWEVIGNIYDNSELLK